LARKPSTLKVTNSVIFGAQILARDDAGAPKMGNLPLRVVHTGQGHTQKISKFRSNDLKGRNEPTPFQFKILKDPWQVTRLTCRLARKTASDAPVLWLQAKQNRQTFERRPRGECNDNLKCISQFIVLPEEEKTH
jgi:hypothetical protein